jgi:Low molecular weight phosphotyrosine protein phosphatase
VTDVPEVLFVCVHNAGRSQMAAALLDHHANGKVVVRSAGSDPADRLNPAVVAAMAELGIDLSREFPKPLTDASVKAADVVITWAAATPARSTRASAMRTGSSRTPPASPSRSCGASVTTSMAASGSSSPSWSRHPARPSAHGPDARP